MSDSGSPVRVLCIDDDPALCSMLTEMLEHVTEWIVAEAVDDPTAAVGRLSERNYDCVVCDYDMPEQTGLETLEQVRAVDPDLPFILYTGKGNEEIASEAISAGVTDYLQKESGPEHYELLANRITEYVDRYRAARQKELTEQRFRRLIEQSVVGIALSQDETFQYANPEFAEMFGYTSDEIVGMSVFDIIDEADRKRVERAIEQREAGDADTVHYVVSARDKSGDCFRVEVSGSSVTYEGEPAVLGVVQRLDTGRQTGSPQLVDHLTTAREALTEVDTDDTLDRALTAVEAALDIAEREVVTDGRTTRTDPGDRLRAQWDTAAPERATLDIEDSRQIEASPPLLDTLFGEFLQTWRDVGEPLTVTLSTDDDGFSVAVEPTAEGRSAVDARADLPSLSRIAERLGWDVFVAESDDGGAVYSFRGL